MRRIAASRRHPWIMQSSHEIVRITRPFRDAHNSQNQANPLKIVVVVLPAFLCALVLAALSLAGRPVSRHGLRVIAALVLFAYVIATSALGVFWVSRMDLPAFDWHYLAGYTLMVLVAV